MTPEELLAWDLDPYNLLCLDLLLLSLAKVLSDCKGVARLFKRGRNGGPRGVDRKFGGSRGVLGS